MASAVSALDSTYALQAALGLRTLSAEQQMACDVSGNGTVSALDASLILQYKVGLVSGFAVAQNCGSDWAFYPAPQSSLPGQQLIEPATMPPCQAGGILYQPLNSDVTKQDFIGVPFGDCTGNWQPSSGGAALRPVQQSSPRPLGSIRLGRAVHRGATVRIPLQVRSTTSFRALFAGIEYDPARLTLRGLRRLRGLSGALLEYNVLQPGRLVLALASPRALSSGSVIVLQFDVRRTGRDAPSAVQVLDASVE